MTPEEHIARAEELVAAGGALAIRHANAAQATAHATIALALYAKPRTFHVDVDLMPEAVSLAPSKVLTPEPEPKPAPRKRTPRPKAEE